jgi:hypothetical protein
MRPLTFPNGAVSAFFQGCNQLLAAGDFSLKTRRGSPQLFQTVGVAAAALEDWILPAQLLYPVVFHIGITPVKPFDDTADAKA